MLNSSMINRLLRAHFERKAPWYLLLGMALALLGVVGGISLYATGKQGFIDTLTNMLVGRSIGGNALHQLEGLWTFCLVELGLIACFGLGLMIQPQFRSTLDNTDAGRLGHWVSTHGKALCLLLMAVGAALQLGVIALGFVSVSADEFIRASIAYSWAFNPHYIASDLWVPGATYLHGLLLLLHNDLFWMPRLPSLIGGLLTIFLMYCIAERHFGQPSAVLTALFVTVFPWRVWLGATSLVEMMVIPAIAGGLFLLMRWQEGNRSRDLLLAAGCMAFAASIRYEPWFFLPLVSLVLLARLWTLRGEKWHSKTGMVLGAGLGILWVVPIAWMMSNRIATHDWLYFFHGTMEHNLEFPKMGYHWLFVLAAPVMTCLTILGSCMALVLLRERALWWQYLVYPTSALVVYMSLNPDGPIQATYTLRYAALYIILFSPLTGYAVSRLWGARVWAMRWVAVFVICSVVVLQLVRTFYFPHGVTAKAMEAGKRLQTMWDTGVISPEENVLLEYMEHWNYIAVAVLSNRPQNIYLDRPSYSQGASMLLDVPLEPIAKESEYSERSPATTSEKLPPRVWDPINLQGVPPLHFPGEGLANILKQSKVGAIVVSSQPLKDRLNDVSYADLVEEVGSIAIYRVDRGAIPQNDLALGRVNKKMASSSQ